MKRNNKGYTLVELMITIAIFGIVMIGIAMIMRTTSVSYVNGSNEVAMQTEVQIVANQIEELLVDIGNKTTVNPDGTVNTLNASIGEGTKEGYVEYYIYDEATGTRYNIVHKDDTDELWFYKTTITGSNPDLTGYSLMAEYVSTFDIDGFSQTDGDTDRDNKVTIEIAMNKDGYTYEVTRDVFFRNAVEDITVYHLSGGGSSVPGSTPTYDYTVEVDRYSVINLEKDYNIASVDVASAAFTAKYDFVVPTFATGAISISEAITSVTPVADGSFRNFLIYDQTLSLDLTSKCLENEEAYLVCTDKDGLTKKILFYTKPVEYVVNTDSAAADGVVYVSNKTGDTAYAWIDIEGINIASMNEIFNMKFQYSIVSYIEDSTPGYQADNANKPYLITVNANSVEHGHSNSSNLYGTNKTLGLEADPEGDGFIITQDNNAFNSCSPTTDVLNAINNGTYRVAFMIHLPGQSATGNHDVIDLAVVTQGTTLTNYQGAKKYENVPASTSWFVDSRQFDTL